jgi:hypothetical protein
MPVRHVLARDEQQARRSRPLLLAEGSSVGASTRRPLAAELDETEHSGLALAHDRALQRGVSTRRLIQSTVRAGRGSAAPPRCERRGRIAAQ